MPVEIRELVIKVAVDETAGSAGNRTGGGAPPEAAPEMIVRTCVEKVLEILKDQRGR
jgi:hypothetical protein